MNTSGMYVYTKSYDIPQYKIMFYKQIQTNTIKYSYRRRTL